MTHRFREEAKATAAAKGSRMGVTNEWLPGRASRISGQPETETRATPPSQEAPQHPENKRGPDYDNNTPNTWVRGANEFATTKPGFRGGP